MTVFNQKVVDHTKEYMFFGEPNNVARYDKMKFERFDKFVEQQHGFFWRPSEINLTKDFDDFNNKLTKHEQFVFTANLKYQTLLDSVQGRAPVQVFLPICSLPELENWIVWWSASETIHSKSYTHIIRNAYIDPSKVFDEIMLTQEILERAEMVTKYYDALEAKGKIFHDMFDWKEALFDAMVAVYALEAVRFYVSFACSYSFAERGLMVGNAKIIKMINRDENLHTGATHFIITRWTKGLDDPEMTAIAKERIASGKVLQIFKDVFTQECAWIDYLFKDGSIPMLNKAVLTQYLEFLCKEALDNLGIQQVEFKQKVNPLPWMESWTRSDNVQVAPQTGEITNYIIGGVSKEDSDYSDLF